MDHIRVVGFFIRLERFEELGAFRWGDGDVRDIGRLACGGIGGVDLQEVEEGVGRV